MTQAITFPPFLQPGNGRPVRGRSWWARAWVAAVEANALDPEPLQHGRRLARSGHLGPVTIEPGRAVAHIHGEDIHTRVQVTTFDQQQWDSFLDQVVSRASHLAALFDGVMTREIHNAAKDAGISLFPEIGNLNWECTCPDWDLPCMHAAALCYQIAWLLDDLPLLIMLLRGRSSRTLLAELETRSLAQPTGTSGNDAADTDTDTDTDPTQAFNTPRTPIPPARASTTRPLQPPLWANDIVPGLPVSGWANAVHYAAQQAVVLIATDAYERGAPLPGEFHDM